MNTKEKIAAMLMASIVAMAVGMPMVMGDTPSTEATVNEVASTYDCSATNISPQPNSITDTNGTVNFELVINDNNGADTIPDTGWTAEVNFGTGDTTGAVPLSVSSVNDTAEKFTGTETVPADTAADNYTVTFKNSSDVTVCTKVVTVTEKIGYSIDFSKVAYGGSLDPGATSEVIGNTTMETTGVAPPVKPTIKNNANVVMDVQMSIADAGGNPEKLFENNTETRVNSSLPADYKTLDNATTTFDVDIAIDATANIDAKLSVPFGTKTGSYTGTLTVTGVKGV